MQLLGFPESSAKHESSITATSSLKLTEGGKGLTFLPFVTYCPLLSPVPPSSSWFCCAMWCLLSDKGLGHPWSTMKKLNIWHIYRQGFLQADKSLPISSRSSCRKAIKSLSLLHPLVLKLFPVILCSWTPGPVTFFCISSCILQWCCNAWLCPKNSLLNSHWVVLGSALTLRKNIEMLWTQETK